MILLLSPSPSEGGEEIVLLSPLGGGKPMSSSYIIGTVDHHDEQENDDNNNDDDEDEDQDEDEERNDREAVRVTTESDNTTINLRDIEIGSNDSSSSVATTVNNNNNIDDLAQQQQQQQQQSQSTADSSWGGSRSNSSRTTTTISGGSRSRSSSRSEIYDNDDESSTTPRSFITIEQSLSMPTKMTRHHNRDHTQQQQQHRTLVHTPNHLIDESSYDASSIEWPSASLSTTFSEEDEKSKISQQMLQQHQQQILFQDDTTTTTTNPGFIGLVIVNDDDDDDDLRNVLASTKAELVQLQHEMDNVKVERDKAQTERDKAQTERDTAQAERDVANSILAKLYPCMDQCADVSHDLLIDNDRLYEKVKENKILKIHIETLVSARETDIRTLTGHVTSLQNEVSGMREVRQADTLLIEQLVLEKKTLEHALFQTEFQLEELTKQVVNDKAIYEEVNKAVGQELNSKETVEANLLAERNKLSEQLLVKEKYVANQKLEQERLTNTMITLIEELSTIKEERCELVKHIDTLHSNVLQSSITKEEEMKAKEMMVTKLFAELDEHTASITTLTNKRDEYSNQNKTLQCDMSRLVKSNKIERPKLTENIATLAEQLSMKKLTISKLTQECAGLVAFSETAVQNINAELNASKALIDEQQLQIETLDIERDGLVKQVEVLQEYSSECLVAVEDLQTQLDMKQQHKVEEGKCKVVVEQLALISNELTSLSMERDNLLADKNVLKRQVESSMAQNDVLQQQIQTFQSKIQSFSRLEDEKNKLLIANVKLSKQIDELALAVKAKDAIETKLLKEQEILNYSINQLSKQLYAKGVIEVELLAEREGNTASITSLHSQLCAAEITVDKLVMDSSKFTDSIANLKGERDGLVKQLNKYRTKIETAENSIITLNEQLKLMKKIEEDMNIELQTNWQIEEQMQLNATIESLEANLLQSKVEQERLGNDMLALMNSHTDALTRVGMASDSCAILESELFESRKHNDNLRVNLETLQQSLDDAMKENQALIVKAVQVQIEAQPCERAESQTNTEREVYMNLDTLARLGMDKDELKLAIQNVKMRKRIAELEKKVNLGDTNCSESAINQTIATLTEKLIVKEDIEAELLAEQEKLTTSITRLSGHYKDMFDAKLQTEREKLTSTITNLKSDRDQLVMQIKSLQSNVSKLTADNEAELRDKKIIKDELLVQQMKLNVTIASLTDQKGIKTELLHEQVHLNNSITMIKTQLDAKEDELRSEQEKFSDSIKVYEEKLSVKELVETESIAEREKLDGERIGLVKQIETAEKSIIALTEQLKQLKNTKEKVNIELQTTKAAASQEKMQLNATIKSLEARLLQSKVEQERLGNDMISLMQSRTDALTHLGVANDSIATVESELLESKKHSDKLRVDLETLEKSLDDAVKRSQEFIDDKVNLDSDLDESRRCAESMGAELDLVRKSLQETTTIMNDLLNEREAVRAETLAIISSDEHGNQIGFEIEQNEEFSRSNDTSLGINMLICATSFEIKSNLSLLQVMIEIKMRFHSLQRDKTELNTL